MSETPPSSPKYAVADSAYDAEHDILKNKLGLTDPQELEAAENEAYVTAFERALELFEVDQRFTEGDVCKLHELFLGDIYEWAGTYRTVDLTSGDIHWCHAEFIPQEMARIDKLLAALTPFRPELSAQQVAERLAVIFGEIIVVHPFREGNGRTVSLLCNLLLLQAGYQPLDVSALKTEQLVPLYHAAIHDVWSSADYTRLRRLFEPLLEKF